MIRCVSLTALLLVAAAPATAQTAAEPTAAEPPKAVVKAKNPNRRICEEFKETGSRLGGKRVCMTAVEWEAQRRDHREQIERAQKNTNYPSSS